MTVVAGGARAGRSSAAHVRLASQAALHQASDLAGHLSGQPGKPDTYLSEPSEGWTC